MRYIISLLLTSSTLAAAPVMAEVPKVVADTLASHALVSMVMGDLGQPELLLAQGANAHDVQLKPSQARALADADLVVWIGPEMTPWLDRALKGLAPDGHKLSLLHSAGTKTFDYGDAADDHGDAHGNDDHDHEHEHEHHDHDHDHEGHDHQGLDPHAWLSPENAQTWLGTIAAELSELDADNAAQYAANAEAAKAKLQALDDRLKAQLEPLKDRPFVTFHQAYGYFTRHYGLKDAGAINWGDATSAGAAKLQSLTETLKEGQIACVFPEAQHDPVQAERLTAASGVKLGPALDPEGSSLTPSADAYETLLQNMADGLTACLKP